MRAAGLTQGELAERSAIGRVTLVRIEKGEQSPRFNTLSAIAHTLELAVEDLLTLSCNRSMEIHDEIIVPGQEAHHGDVPAWLSGSPVWPAVNAQTDGGQLYLHQAMGLELLGQGHNLVISTGTASGKSLVFQAPTLHHLATHPNATAIAVYPIKALARDQVMRWRNLAEASGLDPAAINRIDGDVRDLTERRQILQRTRLALMTPDVIQQWLMAYSEPLYHRRPLRHDADYRAANGSAGGEVGSHPGSHNMGYDQRT